MKLTDVVNRINGNVDRFTTDLEYYIGGEHFNSDELIINKRGVIKENLGKLGFKFHFAFQDRDVIFMARNPHLRKAGMVRFAGLCSDASYILRSKDEKIISQEFLAVLLQSNHFWDYCESHKVGSVNFANNWSTIANYEFDLPSPEFQKELADKVWAAYEVKQSYLKMIEATEEMVKAQFIEMFGTINTPQGKLITLGNLCNIQRGGSPRPIKDYITNDSNGINWIKIGDTDESMYITKTEERIKPSGLNKTRQVYAGDLLLSNSMSFGKPYILKIDGCIHDGWLVLHINDESVLTQIYLCAYLSQKSTYMAMSKLASGGVVQNLNSEIVKSLPVILPPIQKQKEYIALLDQADKSISELRKSVDAIDKVIKSLINENL